MFDHVTLRVADLVAAERFYETVLPTLGTVRSCCSIVQADADHPPTANLHVGFAAPSHDAIDAFWSAGVAAGYRDAGAPGPRAHYREDYYGAFLLDPEGNSIEAVQHGRSHPGRIDHLWLRVASLPASRDFYAAIAPSAGFALAADTPDRVTFRGVDGSFSLVTGTSPTTCLHVAFSAGPDADTATAVAVDPDGNTVSVTLGADEHPAPIEDSRRSV